MNLTKYHLKLHFIVFIWGFTGVLGALISLSSDSLVWWRMLISILGIAVYLKWNTALAGLVPKNQILNFLATGFLVAIHWILFFEAIKISTVSVALICFSSTSLFAALLEPLIFKRKIIGYEIIFGLVAVAGLYMIFEFETQYKLGIFFSLLSAFIGALFTVINAKFIEYSDAKTITLYEMVGGFIGLSFYLLIFSSIDFSVSFSDWIYLLLLGLVCTAYAFVESVDLMRVLSPYTVAISVNLEPVYAIILALIIFGEKEKMSAGFYAGAAVVFITIFANAFLKRKS